MRVTIRPLTTADIDRAREVQVSAFSSGEGDPPALTDEVVDRQRRRYQHFLTHDAAGSWAAEVDDELVGVALALRRESLWGLSMFAVDPAVQGRGIGRQLLDAALRYGADAQRAVILSTEDPKAIRRYAAAGFDLHPQISASGAPRRNQLPSADGRVRDGSPDDRQAADDIDRAVRGAARGPDHELLSAMWRMFVVDDGSGRGYAYLRSSGELETLAATDDETATALLWRCLAATADDGTEVQMYHLTANQQWAVRVALAAGLTFKPGGPVFWRGGAPPPSYLPSGPYL